MRSCFKYLIVVVVINDIFNKKNRITGTACKIPDGGNPHTDLTKTLDSENRCCNDDEFILLNSRKMFRELLPQVEVKDVENEVYIKMLLNYFHSCLEAIEKGTVDKTKDLMLRALLDVITDYLRIFIIPLTKYSYYAGNIRYENAKRMFDLHDQLECHMRKSDYDNYATHSQHVRFNITELYIPPIQINFQKRNSLACRRLIIYPAYPTQFVVKYRKKCFRRRKNLTKGRRKRKSQSQCRKIKRVIIPLPFLDDNNQPNSIALPFKRDNLQSLYSEKSVFALLKYYVTSVKCISWKTKSREEIDEFNRIFLRWIYRYIYPRLNDEKWYPAFGGVLRIVAYLKHFEKENSEGRTGYFMEQHKICKRKRFKKEDNISKTTSETAKDRENSGKLGNTELVIIAISTSLLLWILVGICLVCYRFLRTSNDFEDCPCPSADAPVAVLYKNSEFCKPENRGTLGKLKKSLKNKPDSCPGDCEYRYDDEERCLAAITYSSKDIVQQTRSGRFSKRRKSSKSVTASPSLSPRRSMSYKKMFLTTEESTTDSGDPVNRRYR